MQRGGLRPDEVVESAYLCQAVYEEKPYLPGWRSISMRELGLSDSYSRHLSFANHHAVAFVREQVVDGERTLAVVFQGTEMGSINDWRDNIFGINRHYEFMRPLVEAVDRYVSEHGITRVLATGHSLGGSMAEVFMLAHPDDGTTRYLGCTFGSPGAQMPRDHEDGRIHEFVHKDDMVPVAGRCMLTRYTTPGRTIRMLRPGREEARVGVSAHRMSEYIKSLGHAMEASPLVSRWNDELSCLEEALRRGRSGDDVNLELATGRVSHLPPPHYRKHRSAPIRDDSDTDDWMPYKVEVELTLPHF